MLVYHGTSSRRAEKICEAGFEPRRPSKRVWFAEAKSYALGRAKTQARRTRDTPVVLACEIDLASFRARLGKRRVQHAHGIIAIDGKVPVDVLRSWPKVIHTPDSPLALARWINRILGLKRHKGVNPGHEGVLRLSRWIVNRHLDRQHVDTAEIIAHARQWLPEYFEGVEIDLDRVKPSGRSQTIAIVAKATDEDTDHRSDEAILLLEHSAATSRIRGLNQLVREEDEDAADWCVMMLGDPDQQVQEASLRLLSKLEDANAEAIRPFTRHENKRLRGPSIAAMARHDHEDQLDWFRQGLTDPETHIRQQIAMLLSLLDPKVHQEIFDIARYDPNPRIQETAERVSGRKVRY